MRIDRLAAATVRPALRKPARGAFLLPGVGEEVGEARAAQPPGGIGPAALRPDEASVRDRQAGRRADGMLDALGLLQLSLLDGSADEAALEKLATLADGEAAADPALASVIIGIALRARVELARRRMQATHVKGE